VCGFPSEATPLEAVMSWLKLKSKMPTDFELLLNIIVTLVDSPFRHLHRHAHIYTLRQLN